jgi:hypothetical protein
MKWEADVLKHLKKEWPGHCIEGLGQVHLQKHRRVTAAIEPTTCELNGPKILVDLTVTDESRLVDLDNS